MYSFFSSSCRHCCCCWWWSCSIRLCVCVACFLRTVPTTIFSRAMDTFLSLFFSLHSLSNRSFFFESSLCLYLLPLETPKNQDDISGDDIVNKYIFLSVSIPFQSYLCWLRIEHFTPHSHICVHACMCACMCIHECMWDRFNIIKKERNTLDQLIFFGSILLSLMFSSLFNIIYVRWFSYFIHIIHKNHWYFVNKWDIILRIYLSRFRLHPCWWTHNQLNKHTHTHTQNIFECKRMKTYHTSVSFGCFQQVA